MITINNNTNKPHTNLLRTHSLNMLISNCRRTANISGKFAANSENTPDAIPVSKTINDVVLTPDVMQHPRRM